MSARVTFHKQLVELKACGDARTWVGDKPLAEAWETCERADWMLWLAVAAGVDRKIVVRAACDCARTALKFTKDPRVEACIQATERWCAGEATIEEVKIGRVADADAAAAYAAYAAAYAAYAAYAYAAYAASAAADAAADAYAYAAYARETALKQMSHLVRARIPLAVIQEKLSCE